MRIAERPYFKIHELVNDSRQKEVHGAQSQDRKDVRGVDQERVRRYREDCRNGIDRENQIGEFHEQQHQEQRRRDGKPVLLREEFLSVVVVRDSAETAAPSS